MTKSPDQTPWIATQHIVNMAVRLDKAKIGKSEVRYSPMLNKWAKR